MKKYDVLFLCQFFYPEYNSSAILPYETAVDLSKKGLKVKVVCGYPKEYLSETKVPKKENINDIEIFRIGYLQLSRKSKIGRLINYFSFVLSIILHWHLLINNKCTIVYSNPPILPLITSINKRLFRIKYIFVSYDIYPDIALITDQIKPNSFIHTVMNFINKQMDATVDRVIALSEDMKDYFAENRKGIDLDKVKVIPNWYDDTNLDLEANLQDEEIKALREEYQLIVLYSGNMGICQDVDVLIEAASKLQDYPEICFLFSGHGQKKETLENKVRKLNLNHVKFFGFLSGQKYLDVLKAADCHVISLESGIKGICVPSKTYSYMAIGRPLVSIMEQGTDIGKDILENQLGYEVAPGDSEQLKNYLLELLEQKEEISEVGQRVRKVFLEKYTRAKNTDKYYKTIKELLK